MKKEVNFREMLKKRQEKTKSLVCVGLDPLPEKLPDCMKTESPYSAHLATDIAMWMMRIVDATAPYTSMYKPQRAHWEAIPGGVIALQMVISYIELMYPDIVVFTDCKRGDIGRTQERYKVAQFDIDGTQGMNFSPYMGKDCMQFLVDQENIARALVSLCYTSNESARLTQDQIMADGHPYWEFIATTTLKWAEELGIAENAGLVMAAAYEFPKKSGQVYSRHLSRCRELVGDKLWFLIPGVGTQGGFIKETVKSAFAGYGSIAINSSSDIIFASAGEDFAEAAGEKAKQLYLAIADALEIDRAGLVPQSLIVSGDPLATLKNCGGYYESPKDKDGKFLGPVVAYAGTYDTSSGPKNKVGFVYYDFAFVEDKPIPRDYFAALIAAEV
ncbi:MAG: orotidine-5'-phosphate decarboxylase, partial [Candidatus Falkowbacteria bacterium]|nr:orotidine-5'-phosphate decarboxylase [Candidatus Falkowbacteria bacterium]